MTLNELRTAADDLDRLEELEPRPGRVWLADRLRRGAEWLEAIERVKRSQKESSDADGVNGDVVHRRPDGASGR